MEFRVVDHKHHPFDWEKDGDALREPRIGRFAITRIKGRTDRKIYKTHKFYFSKKGDILWLLRLIMMAYHRYCVIASILRYSAES
jgi:hypothetical protein